MIKRVITAVIGIPLVLGIWLISPLWNELPALALVAIVGLILNAEVTMMVKDKSIIQYPSVWMSVCITLSTLLGYLNGMNILDFTSFVIGHCILFFITFYYILGKEIIHSHNFSENFEIIGFMFIIYISLALLYPQMILLKLLLPSSWGIILLFTFCWVSDAAGLFSGMLLGKTRLKMLPSKSKTLEGYLGSILISTLLGILFYQIQGLLHLPFLWSIQKWALFGLCISLSSNFGDLTESLIKRWADKKDSSNFLPGMGGFFDAIDGQIFSVPIILLFF